MRMQVLVCAAAVLGLVACGRGTKEDIVSKARDISKRAELERVLGRPDEISKLGPVETWRYKASNGEGDLPDRRGRCHVASRRRPGKGKVRAEETTMPLNLRDFLAALGDDLIRVDDEIDPITQAGALCSAAPRPIMLNRLKGFPGWSLCDILVKDRARQAKALGTAPRQVVRELSDRMFTRVPGGSKLVADGPCKEVKLLGADADITKLPIPIHSEGDAGRYLGSGVTITRDPDTGVRNEAIIRALVRGPRKMGFWMAARHNWAHLMKYQERGLPAPMAFAIGLHPGYEILANCRGRHAGYDELEMGAGVLGETLELVKCETIDLEVPAQAEIVIEGVVPPGVREPEGPFGEFTGYSKGAEGPAPVFEVTAITRRRDAIYRHMQATIFTDHQPLVSVPMEASLYWRLSEIRPHRDPRCLHPAVGH